MRSFNFHFQKSQIFIIFPHYFGRIEQLRTGFIRFGHETQGLPKKILNCSLRNYLI